MVGMRTYDIHKPSQGIRKLPLPFGESSSALQAVDENRHGVGEIERHNCGSNDSVERTIMDTVSSNACKYRGEEIEVPRGA
jgi:hypothetical protein